MKSTIYYFSGTGNSLKIARDLSSELDQAEVIFIPDVIAGDEVRTDSEAVGIVFPVYALGIPLIVRDLIRKLVVRHDAHVFIVTNYAQVGGGAVSVAASEIKKRGIRLSSAFGIKMPNNYTPFGGAPFEKRQQEMFEKERAKVKEIACVVRAGRPGPIEKPFFLLDRLGVVIFKLAATGMYSSDREFRVDDNCTSCGICEKVCPADNIKMENGRPRWMSKCQQCLACMQWCPQEAIQLGKMTRGRKRYHNPDVELGDMLRKK